MTGAERADLETLRTEVMGELRALRDEMAQLRDELQQVRREMDRLQGAIQLVRWLGPAGLLALIGMTAKASGLI